MWAMISIFVGQVRVSSMLKRGYIDEPYGSRKKMLRYLSKPCKATGTVRNVYESIFRTRLGACPYAFFQRKCYDVHHPFFQHAAS